MAFSFVFRARGCLYRHVLEGQQRQGVFNEEAHETVGVEDEVVALGGRVAHDRVDVFDLVGLVDDVKGTGKRGAWLVVVLVRQVRTKLATTLKIK